MKTIIINLYIYIILKKARYGIYVLFIYTENVTKLYIYIYIYTNKIVHLYIRVIFKSV